jgi:large subunit ribosomal protein L15
MPYIRRLPKRGFNNFVHRIDYLAVNLEALETHFDEGATVDVAAITAKGLANGKGNVKVKILGTGELKKKLFVTAHKFSAKAKAAIEAAGGSCTALIAASQPDAETPAEQPAAEE